MSGSSDQLAEVFKQVESYFQGHPVISIKPTKGDPPDQYTITYTMSGLQQDSDGEIVESTKHIVELSIPFGFPHFPPSCKPKSEIFHPDFDPAAICLGDVWEQDASLANIILYIGKMINGESFSTKNAFNDEAATWYQENSNRFPLTPIVWGGEIGSRPTSGDHKIDILDEDDLSSDFDYLSLEEDSGEETPSFPEIAAEEIEDIGLLEQLKFQKRFYELSRKLRVSTTLSERVQEFKELADQEVKKCKSLYREAKNLENLGSAAKALKRFEVVRDTVSDYPSIESDIKRVQQTIDLLSDLDPDHFDGPAPSMNGKPPKKDVQTEKKADPEPKKSAPRRSPKDSFFEDDSKKRRIRNIAFAGIGVLAISSIGLLYTRAGSLLAESQQKYQQCSSSLKAGQFTQAKSLCEGGVALLEQIIIFHKGDATQLRNEIDAILLSEELRNGIEGRVLFEGMYLTKRQVTEFKEIKSLINQADNYLKNRQWEKASAQYTVLLDKAEVVKEFVPEQLRKFEEKKYLCQFQIAIESAEKFINEKQWHLAIGSLTHSQTLLTGLPDTERELYGERLKSLLSQSRFEIALKSAESAFNRGDWQDAIIGYESCLNIAHSYTAVTAEQKNEILNTIDRSKLYLTIEKGNRAFSKGNWNEAINAYGAAQTALASNQTLLDEAKLDINRQKLGKIILQASIIRDKQTVKSQLENRKLHEAGKLYNQILQSIEGSGYSSDKDLLKAKKEIHSTLADLNQQIYVSDKEAYLLSNFQSLFLSNYPAAVRENLSQPVINFIKEENGKLLFRMQCTEKRRGSRPLTLVMFYAYDRKSGQWELSSEHSD